MDNYSDVREQELAYYKKEAISRGAKPWNYGPTTRGSKSRVLSKKETLKEMVKVFDQCFFRKSVKDDYETKPPTLS